MTGHDTCHGDGPVMSSCHGRMVDGEQSASHVSGILTVLGGQSGARARCAKKTWGL